jgi:DNA/RNA-binding domain of Phe-tRNA-synthetase-like protein
MVRQPLEDSVQITLERHPRLLAHAFISRWRQPLAAATLPRTAALLRAPLGSCELQAPSDALRAAIRDMLRHGGYKPTGRSKPASEYLLRAHAEGSLGAINPAVDTCNAVSLHSGLPVSVVDLDRLQEPLSIRCAPAEASYVFNPAGQSISLGGLVCLYDAVGPCANAVKDAQRTKTSDATQRTLSILWSERSLAEHTEAALQLYHALLADAAEVEPIRLVEGA